MMAAAEKLIDDEQIEAAYSKMDEVKKLDEKWENAREAQDRLYSMSDSEPQISPEMQEEINKMYGTGERVNLTTGKVYQTGAPRVDSLYLSDRRTMTDVAIDRGGDTDLLMRDGALGDIVRGVVTGKWSDKSLKNMITTSTSGALIPEVLAAQIVDLARAKSLFGESGVPTVPMETNNMKVSRIVGDPVFGFKAEGEEGKELNVDIDSVKLEAKTVYGYAYVSLEAIRSSQNLDAVLRSVFASAIAQAIDDGMLYGVVDEETGEAASYAPEGIMNCPDILTITAENSAYDDFVRAAAAIKQKNYEPSVWAINAYTDQVLALLRDNENRYLPEPEVLAPMQKIVSNQLSFDEENGSDGLVFDPTAMLIGIENDVEIKVIEDEKALKNGLVGFRVHAMLDCQVVSPSAVCRIKGLK